VRVTNSDSPTSSSGIVRANLIGTALFAISAVVAAVVFTEPLRVVGVVVALTLFTVGVFAFLSSYWTAVQRSRTDNIAVAQLYFLGSGAAPSSIKRQMNGALLIQVVVAFATALARTSTAGKSGSTLAFGVLVPMFGLGLNGLWCARHGRFIPRNGGGAAGENTAKVMSNSQDVPPSQ
jgi:hypothetical protein